MFSVSSRRTRTLIAAAVAALAAIGMVAPSAAADSGDPSWSSNEPFAQALDSWLTWERSKGGSNYKDPNDLGVTEVSNGGTYSYKGTGGVTDPGSLSIMTLSATIPAGHTAVFDVSASALYVDPSYTVALHGDRTSASNGSYDWIYTRYVYKGGGYSKGTPSLSASDYANWLQRSPSGAIMTFGDIVMGTASIGGAGITTPIVRNRTFSVANYGSASSKVTLSFASNTSDATIRYHESPYAGSDVESGSHRDDVQWLITSGISTGYTIDGNTTFGGMSSVKRQDMAAFLYRLAGSPNFTPSSQDKTRFYDVSDSTPHAKEIWWLASTGITTGYPDDSFGGEGQVKRQDMAAFLHRFVQKFGEDNDKSMSFDDVDDSTPHAADIRWLGGNGISTGYGDGDFRGGSNVVRQDMAAFLHRTKTNLM